MEEQPARGVVVLILLLILIFSNSNDNSQTGPAFQHQADQVIGEELAALDVLNHTRYGDFDPSSQKYLNITGLRQEDGYIWSIYDDAREKARSQVDYALGKWAGSVLREEEAPQDEALALYHNVTGVLHGEWERFMPDFDLPRHDLNLSAIAPQAWYSSKEFDRNLTSRYGTVGLEIYDFQNAASAVNDSVREIRLRIHVEDDAALSNRWTMILHGVHFVDLGHILVATTSEKFSGVFALPHFALTESMFSGAQELLNSTLRQTIQEQDGPFGLNLNPWTSLPAGSSEGLFPNPHCEYIVHLQEHQRQSHYVDADYISFLERELRHPTGAPQTALPDLMFSMTAYSPDCGFMLRSKGPPNFASSESDHLSGLKTEAYITAFRRALEVYALIIAAQIFFLLRQMKEASTPSTRSRVSYYSISMMTLGDACMAMLLFFASLSDETIYYTSFAVFFLGFASVVCLSLRFFLDVWTVQFTERMRQQRQENPPTRANVASTRPDAPIDILPLPATAARPQDSGAIPIIIPSDQNVGAEITAAAAADEDDDDPVRRKKLMHLQFMFLMIVIVTITAFATQWPRVLRSWYMNTLIFIYLSFWVPQIKRNIIRNCRKALRWDYVVGESLLRLLPVSYIYAVKNNVLSSRTDVHMLLVFCGWVWLQLVALLSQEILGPRFFIPEGWAPPAYDYHPLLREDEEGLSLPLDSTGPLNKRDTASKRAGESKDKDKRIYDCTICAQDVEVPIIPAGGSPDNLAATLLVRRTYMITPCKHAFHTPCLEGWMRYRLQCPNCREILPPL